MKCHKVKVQLTFAFFVLAMASFGCGGSQATPATPETNITTTAEPKAATDPKEIPVSSLINQDGKIDAGLPSTAAWGAKLPQDGDAIAVMTTSMGRIVIKFFPSKAPNH